MFFVERPKTESDKGPGSCVVPGTNLVRMILTREELWQSALWSKKEFDAEIARDFNKALEHLRGLGWEITAR